MGAVKTSTAMRGMLLLLLILIILPLQVPTQVSGQANIGLSLSVAPDKLPADGGRYKSLMVGVKDGGGSIPAPYDIPVLLSSSNGKVAMVDSQLVIPKGQAYIITEIQTTKTAGQTIITAASTGINAASLTVTTVTPTGTPTKLGIYVGPASIPADPNLTSRITVRLEDSRGLPAKAPSDIEVSLILSEPKVGSMPDHVIIPSGEALATTVFRATYTPGSTTITASARDYPTASATVTTTGTKPTQIAVYALPSNLHILDRSGSLIVQLQDEAGNLAKAPADTVVTLTSTNSSLANPEGSVTIRMGGSQAVGSLILMSAAGTVTINAAAEGYTSGSTTVNISAGAGSAASIAVTVATSKIPSDGDPYTVIAVQLLDSGGKLATAPYLTPVAFSSSNSTVGLVSAINIESGRSYGLATFKTTHTPGTTTITATASGYSAATATQTTVDSSPDRVSLSTAPSNLYADDTVYDSLIVQLQNPSGTPVKAISSIVVLLHSSNLNVGDVDPIVTIRAGSDHAIANFHSTKFAGGTTITALVQGYTGGAVTVTTHAPEPYAFALFALPSAVIADGSSYDSIYIQPRDSDGSPAIPWSDITLYLTSSNLPIGDVDPVVTIPVGEGLGITKFHSGISVGETMISALSSGFAPVTLTVSTAHLPISVTVVATPNGIMVGELSTLDITVLSGGDPLPDSQVMLQTNLGSLTAPALTTSVDGHSSTTYSSDQSGEATIMVTVSKQGYQTYSGTLTITVSQTSASTLTTIIIAAGGAAAGAIPFLLYRSGRIKIPIRFRHRTKT